MAIDSLFLLSLMEKYNSTGESAIYITDRTPGIIASTETEETPENILEIASYILELRKPSTISSEPNSTLPPGDDENVLFGTPLFDGSTIWGTILIRGSEANARSTGTIVKVAIESVLAYKSSSISSITEVDEKSRLALNILNQSSDRKSVTAEMNRLELDLNRIRTAIVIKLDHHQNTYFNINLNLGYQSAIESNIRRAVELIRNNKFINAQDLCFSYDNFTLIILKSFLPHRDISKLYLSLDSICHTLAEELTVFKTSFDYRIAYGNLYPDILEVKKSFNEALDMITIGKLSSRKSDIYLLNHLIFENYSYNLHPQMKSKVIIPVIHQLSHNGVFSNANLVSCGEDFVDCCLNFSRTTGKNRSSP